MAEDKIVAGEENFNDDETTDDESEASEDSSVTGESSDEDPILAAVFANRKMYLIESIGRVVKCIEKEMEELEMRRTKVTCPVSLMIMDRLKKTLLNYHGIMQKRLKEVKHGVQPVQESLKEDNQTLTDLEIEINTDEKNENLMTEHGDLQVKETTTDENPKKEGKCMLDLKRVSPLVAEKEMKKSDDYKQFSIDNLSSGNLISRHFFVEFKPCKSERVEER